MSLEMRLNPLHVGGVLPKKGSVFVYILPLERTVTWRLFTDELMLLLCRSDSHKQFMEEPKMKNKAKHTDTWTTHMCCRHKPGKN